MDAESFSKDVMENILRFLSLTNAHFGGNKTVLSHLESWSRGWTPGETIRLLDVGTGGGDIPLAIARWAQSKNFSVHITGIDLVPQIVSLAQVKTRGTPNIDIVAGDVFSWTPALRPHYVIASLFLHHIPWAQQVAVISRLDALAERGVIVSDLERSWPGLVAVTGLSWLCGNDVVRHDGPLSVRRTLTLAELEDLALRAETPHLKARREPWFRLSLAGVKP